MAESKELRELRRLLLAGFTIHRIVLKACKSASEPDDCIEITKTTAGSTARIQHRTEFASRSDSSERLTITIPDDNRSTEVTLRKLHVERVICSDDKDLWNFTLAMHPSLDVQGNRVLRRFRETARQIEESKWLAALIVDTDTRAQYLQQSFVASKGKIDSDLKILLLEYLRSGDWGASRFLPLKRKFFELQHVLLLETQRLLAVQKRICSANLQAQSYT